MKLMREQILHVPNSNKETNTRNYSNTKLQLNNLKPTSTKNKNETSHNT